MASLAGSASGARPAEEGVSVHSVATKANQRPAPDGVAAQRREVRACAVAAGALCLLALFGWLTGEDLFTRLLPGLPSMKVNTALALGLLAVSTWRAAAGASRWPLFGAPLAVALAALTLVQPIFGVDFGLDEWLLRDLATPEEEHPGRMAVMTSVAVLLLGTGLWLIHHRPESHALARRLPVLAALAIAYVASVGFLVGVQWSGLLALLMGSLSLPTASAVLLLGAAVVRLDAARAPHLPTTGGRMFSRAGARFAMFTLPLALFLPAAIAWLREGLVRHGLLPADDGQALAFATLGLLFGLLALGAACWISGLELSLRAATDALARRVDERTAQLRAAEASNQARVQQLGVVGHELRTPLTAVIGFADLLCADATLAPRQRGFVEQVGKAGRHMLKVIGDLTELSLLDAGQAQLDIAALDAAQALHEVSSLVAADADAAGVTLTVDAQGAVQVLADARRLQQVLTNLVGNAIKYNRPGGRVRLHAGPDSEAGYRALVVEDSGLGLTQQQQARLFEPYNRLGREQGEIEGTGLGLALVRSLVQAMGGRIEVRSQPGVGSRFSVHLPAAPG